MPCVFTSCAPSNSGDQASMLQQKTILLVARMNACNRQFVERRGPEIKSTVSGAPTLGTVV
eukprot:1162025-Pelagomonas_calceolata.AAC.2